MPIVMAQSARSGQACVAEQLANKGCCASKKVGYYGTKLYIVAQDRENGLPKAEYIGLTGVAEHDLTALRQVLPVLRDGHLYDDKIYSDQTLKDTLGEGTRKPDRGRKRLFSDGFEHATADRGLIQLD